MTESQQNIEFRDISIVFTKDGTEILRKQSTYGNPFMRLIEEQNE